MRTEGNVGQANNIPFLGGFMKTYQIVNKIYIHKKRKLGLLRIIVNVIMILLILLILFQLSMGESFWDVVKPEIPIFILGLYVNTRSPSSKGYESVALEFTVGPDELHLVYPAINRFDGGGERKETILIHKTDLEKIMYSDELKSIRILAKAIIDVDYGNNQKKSTIDERSNNRSSEYIIYLPYNQAKEIVDEVENTFGIAIERVD